MIREAVVYLRRPGSDHHFGVVVTVGVETFRRRVRRDQPDRVVTQVDSVSPPPPVQVLAQVVSFTFPGLNGCFVPQLQPLLGGGFAVPGLLEVADLFLRLAGDDPPPRRPVRHQVGWYTGDLSVAVGSYTVPAPPQPPGYLRAEHRRAVHRRCLQMVVHHPTVEGSPFPIGAQHPVHHEQVGVQLGVAGPRRVMIEPGDRCPVRHVDPLDAVDAFPGRHRVRLYVVDDRPQRHVVCGLELPSGGRCRRPPTTPRSTWAPKR